MNVGGQETSMKLPLSFFLFLLNTKIHFIHTRIAYICLIHRNTWLISSHTLIAKRLISINSHKINKQLTFFHLIQHIYTIILKLSTYKKQIDCFLSPVICLSSSVEISRMTACFVWLYFVLHIGHNEWRIKVN